jgi:hypothetical protein
MCLKQNAQLYVVNRGLKLELYMEIQFKANALDFDVS